MAFTSPITALRDTLPEALSRALVSAAELRGAPRRELLPTAVPALDDLLKGGLPRGSLVEVVSSRSSGRFSLGLAALAAVTRSGEAAALVDLGDHLDPQAAAACGVDLRRLLWVRLGESGAGACFGGPHAPGPAAGDDFGVPRQPRRSAMKQALTATETLLAAGFPLVVLDLGLRFPRGARQPAAWVRLSRAALVHDAALLVLSPARLTGSAAGAVLSARALRSVWCGASPAGPLLQGLSARLTLEKRAGERPGVSGAWRLRTRESLVAGPRVGPQVSTSEPSTSQPSAHPLSLSATRALAALPARRALRG